MRTTNPYAPPAYSGVMDASPVGYKDESFDYVYDVSLTANQRLADQVTIHNDSDFALRAMLISASTGTFSIRISDSQWYFLSSGLIVSGNLQGDPSSPYPVFPELVLPAGGRIGIDILDTSAAPNVIQILFRGAKRYRVAVAS